MTLDNYAGLLENKHIALLAPQALTLSRLIMFWQWMPYVEGGHEASNGRRALSTDTLQLQWWSPLLDSGYNCLSEVCRGCDFVLSPNPVHMPIYVSGGTQFLLGVRVLLRALRRS